MTNHHIKSYWKGKSVFESETPGGTITTSKPEDGHLGPKALMLDALLGCTGIDIASLLEKMRVKVDDIQLTADADIAETDPKVYTSVKVTYHFFGNDIDQNKVEKAVKLSSEKYCGVMEMFRKFTPLEIEIKYN